MEQPHQSLLGRIWGDIRANPGVWIGVGITALVLVVGYLAYKNSSASAAASGATNSASPTTGAYPNWSTASLGTAGPSNAEIQAELDAIAAYVQNNQTPNPSGVATVQPPRFIGPPMTRPPAPQMTGQPPLIAPGPGGVTLSGRPPAPQSISYNQFIPPTRVPAGQMN